MKDVILYEGILAKFILYISELYFICYGFSIFMNEQVQLVHIREPLAASFTHGAGHAALRGWACCSQWLYSSRSRKTPGAAHQQTEENGVSPHRREEARSRKMTSEVGACRKLVSHDSSNPRGGRRHARR
jgi:hypothetical protein